MKRTGMACMLVLVAISTLAAQMAPGRIELAEFQKLHAAKKVLVVDVRDSQSFENGHIPGAINIPLGDEEQAAPYKLLKAEKRPVVTYCA